MLTQPNQISAKRKVPAKITANLAPGSSRACGRVDGATLKRQQDALSRCLELINNPHPVGRRFRETQKTLMRLLCAIHLTIQKSDVCRDGASRFGFDFTNKFGTRHSFCLNGNIQTNLPSMKQFSALFRSAFKTSPIEYFNNLLGNLYIPHALFDQAMRFAIASTFKSLPSVAEVKPEGALNVVDIFARGSGETHSLAENIEGLDLNASFTLVPKAHFAKVKTADDPISPAYIEASLTRTCSKTIAWSERVFIELARDAVSKQEKLKMHEGSISDHLENHSLSQFFPSPIRYYAERISPSFVSSI